MMRYLFLYLIIFIIIADAWAETSLERFRQNCLFNKNWEQTSCLVTQTNSNRYNSDTASFVSEIALPIITLRNETLGAIEDLAYLYANNLGPRQGESLRAQIIREISILMNFNSLKPCQKACIVKCAAASVLSYAHNQTTKMQRDIEIYESPTGTCTEFSEIAYDLGKAFGLPINKAMSAGHMYNTINLEGINLIFEPQSTACEFYQHEHNTTNQAIINSQRASSRIFTPSNMQNTATPGTIDR